MGHHTTYHGDPLREPLLAPPTDPSIMKEIQIEHKSLFFCYPREFYPPFLGKWEFNTPPETICDNFESISAKILKLNPNLEGYYPYIYECKGHGNAHLKELPKG